MSDKHPLIVICGPTAVGKTDLSIQIAKYFNAEIINGDSMQVFKDLDIGTGKIKNEEKQGIPHHLLSYKSINEQYDAFQFKTDAETAIRQITSRNKLPIVVGGTGLYLEGLLYNLEFGGDGSQSKTIRTELEKELELKGPKNMWNELNQIDPKAAANIPYQNSQRTLRALEVIGLTGELFSDQSRHQLQESVYDDLVIVLDRPREKLYERINQRVDIMIENGLEAETRKLYQQVNGEKVASTKGIGYKEWWPYFQSQQSLETTISQIKQNSRRYAKRQLTWFRNRIKDVHWIDNENENHAFEIALELVENHLNKYKRGN